MERSRAPVARDRLAPYRPAERPPARRHLRPSAEIGGGEMSCDAWFEGLTNICLASIVTQWRSRAERCCPPAQHPSAMRHPPPGGLCCSLAFTFLRLNPFRAQPQYRAARQWWTLTSRRDTSTWSIERSPARRRDHL